jgi:hypothetical protein
MDEAHVRDKPGTVDLPSVDRPELDYAIRITQGERQWWTVEVDNHPRYWGIDISLDPVLVSKDDPGLGVAIVQEFFIGEEQPWANTIRDGCPAVRDGYQERVAFFHHYQQMDIRRALLLIFGWQQSQEEY